MQDIIIKPIITERSIAAANSGKYTFAVKKSVNKKDIVRSIESTFGVKVRATTTSIVKGKAKRVGARRIEKVSSPWKKAVVMLSEGQKIDLFELAK